MISANIRLIIHNGRKEDGDHQTVEEVKRLLDTWCCANEGTMLEVIEENEDDDSTVAGTLMFTDHAVLSVEEVEP